MFIISGSLGLPKIESTNKHPTEGATLELICQAKNLPLRFELVWLLNDRKLKVKTIKNEQNFQTSTDVNFISLRRRKDLDVDAENVDDDDDTFTVIVDRVHNVTVSRLRLKHIDEQHKGVYKCRYDMVEAAYRLDFKSRRKKKSLGNTLYFIF